MDGNVIFLIEAVLLHGAVIGFAVWQIVSINRLQRRKREAEDERNREVRQEESASGG